MCRNSFQREKSEKKTDIKTSNGKFHIMFQHKIQSENQQKIRYSMAIYFRKSANKIQ